MKQTYLKSFCARFLTLLVLALLSANFAWGKTVTSTLTFTAKCNGSGTADDGITWAVTSDGTESNFDNTKGIHYGTNSAAVSFLTLTSAAFDVSYKIKKVVVNCSDANKTAMISVTVGGKDFGTSQQETANDNRAYTFEPTTEQGSDFSGVVVVSMSRTSAQKALYVKSIAVTYDDGTGADPVLQSIAISGTPTKTIYEADEEFDPAGLVVTGTYDVGEPQVITEGITWNVTPSGALEVGTTSVSVTATVGSITSSAYVVNGLTVIAVLKKITIDGNASGITGTDGTQLITVDGIEFGGSFKQNSSNSLWFTSGSGFIYNKESFGKIKKITINYKSGGSGSAYQYIRLGNTVLGTYSETSTNGVKYETSTGGSSNTFIVTGDYEYFCISIGSKNLQASSIVIGYEETAPDTREMPTASFENETINAVVEDEFTITVITNSDGAVTYSSSDDDVATVDSSTGEVHAISAGTATITAAIAGTETYKPASASYTIVIASAPLTGKGTEAEPYTVGDIIALGSNGKEYWVGGTIVGFGVSEKQTDESYKLNYTTDTKDFSQSNFVISDGNGHIAAVELPSGSDVRKALNLKEHLNYIGAPIKVYGKLTTYFNQVGVKSTSDYKLTQQDVTISSAGWATACLPFNATISGNATAYYVTGTDGSTLVKIAASVIPAGEGVLLKSNADGEATVTFTISAKDADDATDNMMKGATTETTFDESGYKYYILANGDNGLGFYYQGADNTTGSSAKCAAGKAVLAIPTSSSAKAFISLDKEPTGIESIQSSTLNPQYSIYNLHGVRVNGNYKGIVIMNGKKYINK